MTEKKDCCGKCYKLDRTRSYCERHRQTVQRMGPATFLKCPACVEAQDQRKGKSNG